MENFVNHVAVSHPTIRHRPIPWVLAAMVLVAAVLAACGSGPGESTVPTDSVRGDVLYESNCASCHGSDLGGTDKGPSHLSVVYVPNHHGDEAFRSAVANGAPQHHWTFGPMPAIEGLDDDEVDAIIEYVRSEQERRGFQS